MEEEEELVDYELEEGGFQQIWSSSKDFIHSHFKVNLEGHHTVVSGPTRSLESKVKNSIGNCLAVRRP